MDIIIISIYDGGYDWSLWYGGDIIAMKGYNEERVEFFKLTSKDLGEVMSYLSKNLYIQSPFCTLIRCEDGHIEKSNFFNFGSDCDKETMICMDKLLKEDR